MQVKHHADMHNTQIKIPHAMHTSHAN